MTPRNARATVSRSLQRPTRSWRTTSRALLLLVLGTGLPLRVLGADVSLREEVDAWHAERIESLRRPDGWLSLVGLFALSDGTHTLGSAPDADLRLEGAAPATIATLSIEDGLVRAHAAEGVTLRHEDRAVESIVLRDDADAPPTVVEAGSLLFHVIERNERHYLRVKDRRAPLLESFEGIDRWPVAPRWHVEARWQPYASPKPVDVPNVLGTVDRVEVTGAAVFEIDGVTHRLDPASESDTSLFFVFGDATNGVESYGGGRFLVASPADENGTVILDFNRAYNPPCVFTPFATCPLPPEGNVLDLRVEAGEKTWGESH